MEEMYRSFSPLYYLFFILILVCTWKSIQSDRTSINGLVLLEKNQSTPSLINNNLVLIIRTDVNDNDDDIHHLQIKLEQNSFPIQFTFTNIKQIKTNGIYFLRLLIFGFTHRLLWEGILFQQYLFVNHVNNITFIVRDVSNLPKCLSEGYPCVAGHDMSNQLISVCCSNTICQSSKTEQMTCGGNISTIQNVTITYTLPIGILPTIGLLDSYSVVVTEKIYQSVLEAGTIVEVKDGTISTGFNNQSPYYYCFANTPFVLQFHVSIMTSQSCDDCLEKAIHSIQTHSFPFNVRLQDGSSIIISIRNPLVYIADVSARKAILQGAWTLTKNMQSPRIFNTACVLSDETVLVTGGWINPSTAELYSPLTCNWKIIANMTYPRFGHTASVLLNGTVLIVGGTSSPFTAELYNPSTGNWTVIQNMTYPRVHHTASVLSNGTVLVTGGLESPFTAEIYDPLTGTWSPTRNMTYRRHGHAASVLSNGAVLIVGGTSSPFTAELYNPSTGNWTLTKNMTYPRVSHTASVLSNGIVLIVGGEISSFTAELYNPLTGTWTTTGNTTYSRYVHTASVLSNETVLIVGGQGNPFTAELYDPLAGNWAVTTNMTYPRLGQTACVLSNEIVLVIGGMGYNETPFSAELYNL